MTRGLSVALICILSLFVGSVAQSEIASRSTDPTNNSLVIAQVIEPYSVSPLGCCDSGQQLALTNLLYIGFTYFDKSGQLQPGFATELPTEENGRLKLVYDAAGKFIRQEVHWTIRDDANWSDGVPVTCADALFSFDASNSPEFVYIFLANVSRVEQVICPDDENGKEILVIYDKPHVQWNKPWASGLTGFYSIAPKHIWEPHWLEAKEKARQSPEDTLNINLEFLTLASATGIPEAFVGNGPFKYEEWVPGQYLRLSRNENFFLKPLGPEENYIQEITIRFIPNQDTQLIGLISGELDASAPVNLFGYDPESLRPNFGERATVEARPDGTIEFLYFNLYPTLEGRVPDEIDCQAPVDLLLTEKRTRQAIIQAIDRRELIDAAFPGGTINESFMVSGDFGWHPDLKQWSYDPDAAKAMFQELGWSDANQNGVLERTTSDGRVVEFRLEYLAGPDTYRVVTGEILQAQLFEVGIALDIIHRPFNIFDPALDGTKCSWKGIMQFQFESGWRTSPDDPTTLQLLANDFLEQPVDEELEFMKLPSNAGGVNPQGYQSDAFDSLGADAKREFDSLAREELVMKMQEIFNEELPRIPLAERAVLLVKKNGLVNYVEGTNVIDMFTFWNPWELGWEQNGAVSTP